MSLIKKPYLLGLLLSLVITVAGFILQLSIPEGVPLLKFPLNLQVGIFYLVVLILIQLYLSQRYIIQWLSSIPASVISMVLLVFWVLCAGLLPQTPQENEMLTKLGFRSVTSSWSMTLTILWFLTSLGLVVLRRLNNRFNWNSFGFFLNHFGLWLTLLAGYMGSGDIWRVRTKCFVGETQTIGYDNNNIAYHLPFSIELLQFERHDYSPSLAVLNANTGEFRTISNSLFRGKQYSANGIGFTVVSEDSLPDGSHKAQIASKHVKYWLTTGNIKTSPQYFELGNDSLLLLKRGNAKSYKSLLRIDNKIARDIQVNAPFQYKGWYIYQTGFTEEQDGSYSSIIELVRDPWLPLVYTGLIMVLIGSVFLFWQKRNKPSTY
jgi:hypothetical protein